MTCGRSKDPKVWKQLFPQLVKHHLHGLALSLVRYVLSRLAWAVFVIWVVVTLTYVLAMVVPANPALLWAGPHATKEQIERAKQYLGLDKPPHERYLMYLYRLVTGDWGISIHTKRPVLQDIAERLPATIELGVAAMLIALLIGIPLGVVTAIKRETVLDHVSRVMGLAGVALPAFWLAVMLQLVLAYWLRILPVSGRIDPDVELKVVTGFYLVDSIITMNWAAFVSALKHIILPALVLATAPIAIIMRVTRASVLEVLGKEYVRTVLAYGLPRRLVLFRYVLKPASLPVVTLAGLEFGYILAGVFVVEYVFDWPGLGRYAAEACLTMDYPAILGTVVVVAIIYSLVNLVVDILYAYLDPRIRY
jgi:peptide/nickel transport system permease protein